MLNSSQENKGCREKKLYVCNNNKKGKRGHDLRGRGEVKKQCGRSWRKEEMM